MHCISNSRLCRFEKDKECDKSLSLLQRRRERTQRAWRGSTSSSTETWETCVSKNLDETVRLQNEKREEWIQEVREEEYKKLQGE